MRLTYPLALAAICIGMPAFAGNENTVFFVQDSTSGPGNTLVIDQSAANGSLLAGSADGLNPARQTGGGNAADLTIEGERAVVLLNQNNAAIENSLGNSATIFGGDLSSIVLNQVGSGNTGFIQVTGSGNTGELSQIGDDNDGSVIVSGTDTSGVLNQNGDRNVFSLEVSGNSTSVVFNQNGNDLSSATGAGPQVFSNGGTVIITQTVLP